MTRKFAYNTLRHESTKFTPIELMFGRRATLSVDLDTGLSKPEKIVAEYMHTKKVDLEECQHEKQTG